jgi:hypothetical protein
MEKIKVKIIGMGQGRASWLVMTWSSHMSFGIKFFLLRNPACPWKRAVLASPSFKNRMRDRRRAIVLSREASTRQCFFRVYLNQFSLFNCQWSSISHVMACSVLIWPTCRWLQDWRARVRHLSLMDICSKAQIEGTDSFQEASTTS